MDIRSIPQTWREERIADLLSNRNFELTERRKNYLRRNFPFIDWIFENAKLKSPGIFGDRPQFLIPGTFGELRLLYKQQSPGGGDASLRVIKDGKKLFTIRAYGTDADAIHNMLRSYL